MPFNGDLDNIDQPRPSADNRRSQLWPFWTRVYAQRDPLPDLRCSVDRPHYSFDEGEELPDEYRVLLMKMLRHEASGPVTKAFSD